MEQIDKYLIDDWQKLTAHVKRMAENETPVDSTINELQKTALQRLARRYRRFYIMALCCLPLGLNFLNPNIYSSTFRYWVAAVYIFVMLSCAICDRWLYRTISSISVTTMPVVDFMAKVWLCRKRHLQFIAFFLPIDFLFIGLIYAAADHNIAFVIGLATGAVSGLAIGLRNLYKFLADYREIFTNDD